MTGRLLAVTPGDPEGIGPEIVWKALRKPEWNTARTRLLCIGAADPFRKLGAPIIEADPSHLVPPPRRGPFVWLVSAPARGRFVPGFQSGWSIETATRLALQKKVAALVTGPISKERLNRGGYPYPGHTEFLADLCNAGEVTMMLANDTLRIALVTTHLGLKDVPKALTRRGIRRAVEHCVLHLRRDFKIAKPKIAVAALNPHAGESGLFGREEIRVITPELEALARSARGRFEISGPHPADTLFAKHLAARPRDRADVVVCMYHDQGLIPVKLIDFPRTVNITLGLPIVRTSVDHGVGFDIAGKGIADPSSFQAAVKQAERMT